LLDKQGSHPSEPNLSVFLWFVKHQDSLAQQRISISSGLISYITIINMNSVNC